MGGGVCGWLSMECGVFVDGDCLRGCLHERVWRLGIGMKLWWSYIMVYVTF